MIGTDASYTKIAALGRAWAPLRRLVTGQAIRFGGCLSVVLLAWLILVPATAPAADITLPTISPYHTIHIQAQTLAQQTRGSYEVYAFRGECALRQGDLTATCDDLIIWIDRTPPADPNTPRKVITTMEGNVCLNWESKKLLQDSRWMGYLFSFQEVQFSAKANEHRNDIPRMDWSHESQYSRVVPAQFSGPGANAAPPLLPAPGNGTLPAPRVSAGTQVAPSTGTLVQPTPGGIAWPDNNAPTVVGQSMLPSGGLAIPDDGGQPIQLASLRPLQLLH